MILSAKYSFGVYDMQKHLILFITLVFIFGCTSDKRTKPLKITPDKVKIKGDTNLITKIGGIVFTMTENDISFGSAYLNSFSQVFLKKGVVVLDDEILQQVLIYLEWDKDALKTRNRSREVAKYLGITHFGFVIYTDKYVELKIVDVNSQKELLSMYLQGPHQLREGPVVLSAMLDKQLGDGKPAKRPAITKKIEPPKKEKKRSRRKKKKDVKPGTKKRRR